MSFLGNVIWLLFGGFVAGMGYILGGLATCLTIVGIPFGIQSIKLGIATLTPFGREIVVRPESGGFLEALFNILWAVLFGWEIAVAHLVHAAILALTIVGLPFASQHLKLIPLALFPFGKELR
ncbi:YccF domain-containing protein [Levilinea saccharolytica]|uniref:Membrane protein n=1 Tax=Levilinea saccharolytica TaxID=229921 RepID=A0A0M8JPP4_9CHLR|nr:YccF domain-containing protein [Levilinea saccharolytica]KPL80964.1 membrane protein [Levilinea saccharolytica]GAP19247.1 predicted membrane protein [Levilinea saccharolytica]